MRMPSHAPVHESLHDYSFEAGSLSKPWAFVLSSRLKIKEPQKSCTHPPHRRAWEFHLLSECWRSISGPHDRAIPLGHEACPLKNSI